MNAHAESVKMPEAHAKLSASGSHRWLHCPASVRMEAGYADTTSSYAEEGSAAHALAERCLREHKHADAFLDTAMTGYPDYPVDAEMAEAVQLYLDTVRGLPGELLIERRVDFSPWVPGGFGTSDAIVLKEDTATIVDLKFGRGVKVNAADNPQAMLYALGALNDYEFLFDGIERFKLMIVQPRLDHISDWTVPRQDLLAFGDYAKGRAGVALEDDAPFQPGQAQCRFCKAKAVCRALAEHNLKTAAQDFQALDAPITAKDPLRLDNAAIAVLLAQLDLIADWIKAIEAHAIHELEHGRGIPGYKLVAGRALRKWRDDQAAEQGLSTSGLEPADLYVRKLISPAQAEKILGKKHPLIAALTVKPQGKPTIAPVSDKRPPLATSAADDFQAA